MGRLQLIWSAYLSVSLVNEGEVAEMAQEEPGSGLLLAVEKLDVAVDRDASDATDDTDSKDS